MTVSLTIQLKGLDLGEPEVGQEPMNLEHRRKKGESPGQGQFGLTLQSTKKYCQCGSFTVNAPFNYFTQDVGGGCTIPTLV